MSVKNKSLNEIKTYIKSKGLSINDDYIDVLISFYFSMFASMFKPVVMTSSVKIPINMYACQIAPSGSGKGVSSNILENEILDPAIKKFTDVLYPLHFEQLISKLNSGEQNEMMKKDVGYGAYVPFFSEISSSASIKQIRQKILFNKLGSINLIIDEIGSNLDKADEALTIFLELYDNGFLKQKLLKSSKENSREMDLRGSSPSNLLMFGTNSNLLDGGLTEKKFKNLLEQGYARRSFFAVCTDAVKVKQLTGEEEFDRINNSTTNYDDLIFNNRFHFEQLVVMSNINKKLKMSKEVEIVWLNYKIANEAKASKISEFEILNKIELSHRHSKVLKLAGAFAFIDGNDEILMENLEDAIYIGETSGSNFKKLLELDKPFERLAKFIKSRNSIVTPTDLEVLPFYPTSKIAREEMLKLAESYALNNEFIINTTEVRGIKYYRALTFSKNNKEVKFVLDSGKKNSLDYSEIRNICSYPGQKFSFLEYVDNTILFNTIALKFSKKEDINQVSKLIGMFNHFIYEDTKYNIVLFPLTYNFDLPKSNFDKIVQKIIAYLPFKTGEVIGHLVSLNTNKFIENFNSDNLNLLNFFDDTPSAIELQEKINNFNKLSKDTILKWFALNMKESNIDTVFDSYTDYLILTEDTEAGFKIKELQNFNKHFVVHEYVVKTYLDKILNNIKLFK